MKILPNISRLVCLTLLILTWVSCSSESSAPKPDLTTVLEDTRGLQVHAPVFWQGQSVGSVLDIQPEEQGFRVDIQLDDHLKGHFHEGLAARAIGEARRPQSTSLNLYAGRDLNRPKLASGQRIPEAMPHQALNKSQMYWIAAGLAAIVLVILAVKTIKFVVKLGLAVALCAAAFFYFSVVWEQHGHDLVPEAVSARIDQFLATHEIPEHLDAWMETIKADVQTATGRAKEHGREASESMAESVKDRVRAKIEEVGESSEAGRMLKEFLEQL